MNSRGGGGRRNHQNDPFCDVDGLMLFAVLTLTGFLLGRLAAGWAAVLLRDMNSGGLITCGSCGQSVPPVQRWLSVSPIRCQCGAAPVWWPLASAMALAGVFLGFAWLLLNLQSQTVDEVRPDLPLVWSRLPFHLSLITLLWVATLTDLLDYVIPDEVIASGILIALVAAFSTGQLQMIHIWVNWDDVIPGVRGPYLPDWMSQHQHLHGLAWSLAGLACGASMVWLIRWLSQLILGQPAMGFGDVTLMAMVGAYIGWQPVLVSLALAPLTGLVIGMAVRLSTGRGFVAYGPYLAASSVIVISTWRWLWADYFSLRDIFSHWPSVAGLVLFSFLTLIVLLTGLRIFRSLPAERIRR